MGPTWVLSASDGPHIGPMNLAIRALSSGNLTYVADTVDVSDRARTPSMNWWGARRVTGNEDIIDGIPWNEQYYVGKYASISGNKIQAYVVLKQNNRLNSFIFSSMYWCTGSGIL